VATMGFRGEALAAIASVSEASIFSAPGQDTPSCWTPAAASCAPPPAARARRGVKELFFSTPARRKFLKSDATELAHCIEAVRRHALARPDVGFAIWHEGKLVEQWRAVPAGTRRMRPWPAPGRCAGRGVCGQHPAVQRTSSRGITVGRPVCRTPPAPPDQQYCYVNGRFVRDKVLTHAARAPTKTCCTATSSRCMRCTSRSTRPGGCERAPHQDRGALSRQPRSAPGRAPRHRGRPGRPARRACWPPRPRRSHRIRKATRLRGPRRRQPPGSPRPQRLPVRPRCSTPCC
jgi:hypothetical protein